MNRSGSFLLGALLGGGVGLLLGYVFSPAPDADFDRHYRSRLDQALDEGRKAAAETEAELRRRFEEAKRRAA